MERATTEYRKYQANTLSPIEHFYLDTIKSTAKEVKRQRRGKEQNWWIQKLDMTETNRIEYKRELTPEFDIEKEVVALFHEPTFARCVYM